MGLLETLQEKLDSLVNLPTNAQRFLVNPTAFNGLLGAPTLPEQQGFADAATSLPAKNPVSGGALNPASVPYDNGYQQGEPVGIAAQAAYPIAQLVRHPQAVARMASPLYAPQTTTESAVTGSKTLLNALGNPEAEALSRLRYDTAASPSLTNNVSTRQGAWNANGVMEYNPMYVAKTPRTLNVGANKGLLQDLAQTATNLEQDGAAITRATPLPWGDMSKGNAAILTNNGKALTANQIKKLGSAFADMDGVVLQHRADGEGLVFSGYGDHSMDSIVKKVNETIPGLKIKPALSSEGVDRKYMMKQEYPDYGAVPRNINPNGMKTEDIDAILQAMGYRD